MAATALVSVSACRVNVDEGGNEEAAAPTNEAVVQQQEPPSDSNPDSIARARDLALSLGNEAQRAQMRTQAQQQMQNMRVVVDISDRQLRVFQGDRQVQAHPVAVGSEEWPTPTGTWDFHRVDIHPEWNPPKSESWAEDETRKGPGDPENPMGDARLVYRMPNTVHGTDDLASLGKNVSHGSIRVANEVVIRLAEMLLKAGGSWEGQPWFQQMVQNKNTEFQVELAQKIPIEVQE